ncbi:MAG: GntR family transcriptional regulator [Planctomycetes bacterium]|nr:GntR family transcriptional regulator [Planctomycetota bacterium]
MLLELDNHNGVPIYRQVVDQIRQQVLTGRLVVGEQLPSVRELGGRLKVNPMTVSKAYSMLESEKVLERRRGVGLFVGEMNDGLKKESGDKILEELLRKAAVAAVQLEMKEEQVHEKLGQLYQHYKAKAVK